MPFIPLYPSFVADCCLSKLMPIEEFLCKHHTRKGAKGNIERIAFHELDAGIIEDHREMLSQALDEFEVRF